MSAQYPTSCLILLLVRPFLNYLSGCAKTQLPSWIFFKKKNKSQDKGDYALIWHHIFRAVCGPARLTLTLLHEELRLCYVSLDLFPEPEGLGIHLFLLSSATTHGTSFTESVLGGTVNPSSMCSSYSDTFEFERSR